MFGAISEASRAVFGEFWSDKARTRRSFKNLRNIYGCSLLRPSERSSWVFEAVLGPSSPVVERSWAALGPLGPL
eukprot:4985736-Pyramimonas_sp.AAC.1